MWLITTFGFFSIVEKPEDRGTGHLTVRARVRADLEQLQAKHLPELGPISESRHSDYRFRARAPREAVTRAIAEAARAIDYDNFKDAVAARQGYPRARAYGEVWEVLYGLQKG
jgi:hypothetical protein